jgi:hypothetical protein
MANTPRPISFHPLTLEQAIAGLLKVKPPVQKKPMPKAKKKIQ